MDNLVDDILFLDFPNICRICLNKEEVLKPFEQMSSSLDVFKNITNIEIEFEDDLPKNVCNNCIQKLEDIAAFIDFCKSNDENLRKVAKQKEKLEIYLMDTSSDIEIKYYDVKRSDDEASEKSEKNDCTESSEDPAMSVETDTKDIEPLNPPSKHSTRKQPSVCQVCNENFSTKRQLTEHQNKNINCKVRQYKCANCEKAFYTKFRLNLHMRSHTKETPHECKLCGKRFRFAPNLKRHDDVVHKGLKPFKCDVCGKEYSRKHRVQEHMKIHKYNMGEEGYTCGYCTKKFTTISTFRPHIVEHKIQNHKLAAIWKECDICHGHFPSSKSLNAHKAIIHVGEKKFLCTICGRKFLRKLSLDVHLRVHSGEKPFECKECGKKFSQECGYKRHIAVHTGERSYKCEICKKSFKQSAHLYSHFKTHTKEKSFKCHFCGKCFTFRSTLKVHIRIHTGETSHHCPICNKGFYDSTSMKKHKKTHDTAAKVVQCSKT